MQRPDLFRLLPSTAVKVKVSFFSAAPADVAQQCPTIATLLTLSKPSRTGAYTCSLERLASVTRQPPSLVLADLRGLAAASTVGFELSSEQGPAYELLCSLEGDDIFAHLTEGMVGWLDTCARHQTHQLDTAYRALSRSVGRKAQSDQESILRALIEAYFGDQGPQFADALDALLTEPLPLQKADERALAAARRVQDILKGDERAGTHAICEVLMGIAKPPFNTGMLRTKLQGLYGSCTHFCGWDLDAYLEGLLE